MYWKDCIKKNRLIKTADSSPFTTSGDRDRTYNEESQWFEERRNCFKKTVRRELTSIQ